MTQQIIAVAGNIGVGKSSLSALLAARLGWQLMPEPVEQNPYLADFYADMRRWGFHSQLFFLAQRLHAYHTTTGGQQSLIQDRSLYEDAEIFAETIYRQGAISERDWQTYCTLYRTIAALMPPPDLVVYLRASLPTLQKRIAQRGRAFEQSIDPDYLARLNARYDEWAAAFDHCPLLVIATDPIDFVASSDDLMLVAAQITGALNP
jgi:deoxyadenosine/deoxycytidine kinase